MTLRTQIQETIKGFRTELPLELSQKVEEGAGEISALSIVENALGIGNQVEDFTLKNKSGEEKSLRDYLKKGPVILTFYRGVWCPYCNLQLAAYNKSLSVFESLGAQLVALTPEGPDAAEALNESSFPEDVKKSAMLNTDFDVLHDEKNVVASRFGLVFKLPKAHKDLFEMMNLDVEKANSDDSLTFSDPATYIVGTDFKIKWAFVPNNYRKRAEPADIIEALKKID